MIFKDLCDNYLDIFRDRGDQTVTGQVVGGRPVVLAGERRGADTTSELSKTVSEKLTCVEHGTGIGPLHPLPDSVCGAFLCS